MAKKPKDPAKVARKEAINRLKWSLVSKATGLAMTGAPDDAKLTELATFLRETADELDKLAGVERNVES